MKFAFYEFLCKKNPLRANTFFFSLYEFLQISNLEYFCKNLKNSLTEETPENKSQYSNKRK